MRGVLVGLIGLAVSFLQPQESWAERDSHAAIPSFARRYGVSCQLCHNPFPRLTGFGETFAANGFRMSPGEVARDTLQTGDRLLTLLRDLPLAIRVDAYLRAFTDGDFATDLETPYNMKILSGGSISNSISYYLYFFLFERGEVGGIEDAFIYWNDIGGGPVDLAVGQFQVSDPLFKRELRLEFEDFAVYRARIGLQSTDLTYDRGLAVIADALGFTITGELINGNGKGPAEPNRRLDSDALKNVMGHVSREVVPGLRLGALGYLGHQDGLTSLGEEVQNDVWMVGADATISVDHVELNAQYLHREDDLPTFEVGETEAETDGGFVEVLYAPPTSRWYGLLLYNRVDANLPLLNVRLGGPSNIRRYETLTFGLGRLWRRNLRLYGEATWDLEQDEARWTLGLSTAF